MRLFCNSLQPGFAFGSWVTVLSTCVTLPSSLFPNYLWIFWTLRALLQIHLDSTGDLSPMRDPNIIHILYFWFFNHLEHLGGALLKNFRKPRWITFSSPLTEGLPSFTTDLHWSKQAEMAQHRPIKLSECLGVPVLKVADPDHFLNSTEMCPTPATSSVTLSHTNSFDS